MALRVSASMGRALCGRVTQLQRSGPSWGASKTPRRVHDAGAIQAYLAQEKFAASRRDRPKEVRQIENARHTWAVQPPRTPVQWNALRREESRFARLTRPHRRTLAFRTRKKGTQALEMDNNQAFSVTPDRMSILLGRGKDGFRGPLRRALPENCEAFIPVGGKATRTNGSPQPQGCFCRVRGTYHRAVPRGDAGSCAGNSVGHCRHRN